mmetsp:Transcript_14928/g.38334  ORF Transcript_14928/g.38334 Transcript_14928/m.38334 type:complete len:231 (-) Transcript_14928:2228-2920(-)
MSGSAQRYAVLVNGDPPDFITERYGNYGDIYVQLLRDPAREEVWDVFRAFEGSFPEEADIASYDTLIFTGSKYDAYKDEDWIVRCREIIIQAHARKQKILVPAHPHPRPPCPIHSSPVITHPPNRQQSQPPHHQWCVTLRGNLLVAAGHLLWGAAAGDRAVRQGGALQPRHADGRCQVHVGGRRRDAALPARRLLELCHQPDTPRRDPGASSRGEAAGVVQVLPCGSVCH